MERNDHSAPSAPRKRVGAVHRQGEVSGRKGFVKYHINAEMIRKDIDKLCAAGVPLGRITVGRWCSVQNFSAVQNPTVAYRNA